MKQAVLDFGGGTFSRELDGPRLTSQLSKVFGVMRDGNWHTLSELAEKCGGSEAGVSARIRDFRKDKFGGRTVHRERIAASGTWRYRMVAE